MGIWNGAVLPGLLLFILHAAFVHAAAVISGHSVCKPADFVRYDSYHYLEIAEKGYTFFPCHEQFEEYDGNSDALCGNAGWMPLYPLLIRMASFAGMEAYPAAFNLSKLFCLMSFIFLALLMRLRKGHAWSLSLLPAVFFPSSVYYQAVFPVSMMLFLMLACMYWWETRRYLPAAACAVCTSLSYSTGFTGALIWGSLSLVLYRKKSPVYKSAFIMALMFTAGFIIFIVWQQVATGAWNAFFQVQAKYGHGFHNVLTDLRDLVKGIIGPGYRINWQPVQTILMLSLTVFLIIKHKRLQAEKLSPLVYLFVLGFFPFFIGSGQLSMFRAESLLLPAVLLLPPKRNFILLLTLCFALLFFACTHDFFTSKII